MAEDMFAQKGWICPKCGRVNAPWLPTCGCVSSQTSGSGTPYLVKTSSISRDSHEVADTPQTDIDTEEFVEGMKNLKMEVKQTDCSWK